MVFLVKGAQSLGIILLFLASVKRTTAPLGNLLQSVNKYWDIKQTKWWWDQQFFGFKTIHWDFPGDPLIKTSPPNVGDMPCGH